MMIHTKTAAIYPHVDIYIFIYLYMKTNKY